MKRFRLLYRGLLFLHPASFRQRFGDEMLDIFDLSAGDGYTAYLLFDGARSLVVQHAKPALPEKGAASFCLEVRTSCLTAARIGQAAVLGGALLFLLASLVVQEMPPLPVANAAPACHEAATDRMPVAMEIGR